MGLSIDPPLMHRVAVIGAGTLDSLPHNGAVVTLLAVCGSTIARVIWILLWSRLSARSSPSRWSLHWVRHLDPSEPMVRPQVAITAGVWANSCVNDRSPVSGFTRRDASRHLDILKKFFNEVAPFALLRVTRGVSGGRPRASESQPRCLGLRRMASKSPLINASSKGVLMPIHTSGSACSLRDVRGVADRPEADPCIATI
jgi:hypothetical protein